MANMFVKFIQGAEKKDTIWAMPTFKNSILSSLILLAAFLLSSCTPSIVQQTTTRTPTIPGPTDTRQPTLTPTPTRAPTPSPTPLILYPVPYGTPFPLPSMPLTADNIQNLTQLAVVGEGYYKDIAWSNDGLYLAVSSTVGAYLYDSKSMTLLFMIPSEGTPQIAISGDSNYMAVTTNVGVFLVDTRAMTSSLVVRSAGPILVSLSNDSHALAIAVPDQLLVQELPSHRRLLSRRLDHKVGEIAFLPDNASLVACRSNGTVDQYDLQGSTLNRSFGTPDDQDSDCHLQVSGDGTTLAWWNRTMVHLWNLVESTPGITVTNDYVHQATLSRDGSTLVVQSGKVGHFPGTSFWDTRSGIEISTLDQNFFINNPASDYLAVSNYGFNGNTCPLEFNIIRMSDHKPVNQLYESKGFHTIAINPKGTLFASASLLPRQCKISEDTFHRNFIKVWDIATGEVVGTHISSRDYPDVKKIAIAPDDRIAAIAFSDDWQNVIGPNQVLIWDQYGEEPVVLKRTEFEGATFSMSGINLDLGDLVEKYHQFIERQPDLVTSDGAYRLGPSPQGYALLDNRLNTVIQVLPVRVAAAFSPNNELLVVLHHDNSPYNPSYIEVWDLRGSTTYLRAFDLDAGMEEFLQFSPDGSFFVTMSEDLTLRVWGVIPPPSIATINCTSARAYTVPAETFTKLGYGKFTKDSGKLVMFSNGTAQGFVDIQKEGNYNISIRSKGSSVDGIFPVVNVLLNGKVVKEFEPTSAWEIFSFEAELQSGVQDISLAFTNDAFKPPEDRNVWFDWVDFECP